MALSIWGYRSGRQDVRKARIANTAVSGGIKVGDMLKFDGAGDQFLTQCGAGDIARAVALEPVPAANIPTTDGDVVINADFSDDAIYEYPPDAGTVSLALVNKTCDVGGAQSIDIDASTDDGVEIVDVDIAKNSLFVRLRTRTGLAGVV